MPQITTRIPDTLQSESVRSFLVEENGAGGISPAGQPISEYEQDSAFEPNGTGGFQMRLSGVITSDPAVEESAGNGIQPRM